MKNMIYSRAHGCGVLRMHRAAPTSVIHIGARNRCDTECKLKWTTIWKSARATRDHNLTVRHIRQDFIQWFGGKVLVVTAEVQSDSLPRPLACAGFFSSPARGRFPPAHLKTCRAAAGPHAAARNRALCHSRNLLQLLLEGGSAGSTHLDVDHCHAAGRAGRMRAIKAAARSGVSGLSICTCTRRKAEILPLPMLPFASVVCILPARQWRRRCGRSPTS